MPLSSRPATAGLTIATTHTQARYALVQAIMNYRRRFPRVPLNIQQVAASDVARRVADGSADVGIANEALALDDRLESREIYRWAHIAVVPHAHPLARRETLSLRDLAAHPLILTEHGIAGRGAIDQAFAKAGLPMDVSTSLKVGPRITGGLGAN